MFICANKYLALILLLHLLILCESWPGRRYRWQRGPIHSRYRRIRQQGRTSDVNVFNDKSTQTEEKLQDEKMFDESQHDTAPEASARLYTDEGDRLFDGDMVLDQEQAEVALGIGRRRKATGDLRRLWPDAHIPYAIGPASEPDRPVILKAIAHWEMHTCVTFEEVPPGQENKVAHVVFRKLTGCHSNVGKAIDRPNQAQTISIGVGCNRMGITAHEIGHSLGFYHEQSRPDRDEYIKVYTENVNPKMLGNFDLEPAIKYYGVPYDYNSVMHYAVDAFTKNKKNTLVAKDFAKTFKVGQRQGLSFLDIKLANQMYGCGDSCTQEIACDNDGFIDKTCKCICAPGYEGTFCQFKIHDAEAVECGGHISEETTISTPNYPNNYPKDVTCVWEITAGDNERVSITFVHFDLNFADIPARRCFFDVTEVRPGPDLYDGLKYCGEELDGKEVVSAENKMVVLFHSTKNENQGFEASLSFLPA